MVVVIVCWVAVVVVIACWIAVVVVIACWIAAGDNQDFFPLKRHEGRWSS